MGRLRSGARTFLARRFFTQISHCEKIFTKNFFQTLDIISRK